MAAISPPPARRRSQPTRPAAALLALILYASLTGAVPASASGPTLALSSTTALPGSTVRVDGSGLPSNTWGTLQVHTGTPVRVRAKRQGVFSADVTVPLTTEAKVVVTAKVGSAITTTWLTLLQPAPAPSPSPPPEPPPTTGTGPKPLPPRSVGGYWPQWSWSRLNTVSQHYNVIWLAFAKGSLGTSGTGAVTYSADNFTDAQMKTDIAELRANGVRVLLSVGGEGGYTHLNTTARRQAFFDSIVTIYNNIGPFDGLDWNFEVNYGTHSEYEVTEDTLANIIWISQELKRTYGSDFAITKPAAPGAQHDKKWMVAMHSADPSAIDAVNPQYYDWAGWTNQEIINNLDEWVSLLGANKIGMGLRTRETYLSYGGDPAFGRSYDDILYLVDQFHSTHPQGRGAFVWHTNLDAQEGYWFAESLRAAIPTSSSAQAYFQACVTS